MSIGGATRRAAPHWLLLTIALAAGLGCAHWAGSQSALASATEDHLFILSVDTPGFADAVGLGPVVVSSVSSDGVRYVPRSVSRPGPGVVDLGITVTQSAEQARAISKRRRQFVHLRAPPGAVEGIGDELFYSYFEGTGILWLQRWNVHLFIRWEGPRAGGLDLARAADQVLVGRDDICPKGGQVVIPTVEVELASQLRERWVATAEYRVTSGERVRSEHEHEPHVAGSQYVYVTTPGRLEGSLQLVTEGNLVFEVGYHAEVLSAADFEASDQPRPWGPDPDWLWFAEELPGGDDAEAEPTITDVLVVDKATYEWLVYRDDLRQTAVDEIGRIVQRRWLPPRKFVEPFREHLVDGTRLVYTAAYRKGPLGVIYSGRPGSGFWLCILQPDPPAPAPVSLDEVVQPEFLAALADEAEPTVPAARVRAYERRLYLVDPDTMECEPVRLLIIEVRLPGAPDIPPPLLSLAAEADRP